MDIVSKVGNSTARVNVEKRSILPNNRAKTRDLLKRWKSIICLALLGMMIAANNLPEEIGQQNGFLESNKPLTKSLI